jgi:hypothetical protein
MTVYINPLQAMAKAYEEKKTKEEWPNSKQLAILFSNIGTIHQLNTQFLKDLEGRVLSWLDHSLPDQCLGMS